MPLTKEAAIRWIANDVAGARMSRRMARKVAKRGPIFQDTAEGWRQHARELMARARHHKKELEGTP